MLSEFSGDLVGGSVFYLHNVVCTNNGGIFVRLLYVDVGMYFHISSMQVCMYRRAVTGLF